LADEGLNEIRALPAPSSASMIDLTAIDITPVEEEVQVTVPSRKTRRVQ
ncbi:MAG: hypothetical protein RLZZ234_278, partial [Candidatus Parcubacteria bacterium]